MGINRWQLRNVLAFLLAQKDDTCHGGVKRLGPHKRTILCCVVCLSANLQRSTARLVRSLNGLLATWPGLTRRGRGLPTCIAPHGSAGSSVPSSVPSSQSNESQNLKITALIFFVFFLTEPPSCFLVCPFRPVRQGAVLFGSLMSHRLPWQWNSDTVWCWPLKMQLWGWVCHWLFQGDL